MGTAPFLWIGIGIADPYHFPDPDPDPTFVIRSFVDPNHDPRLRT